MLRIFCLAHPKPILKKSSLIVSGKKRKYEETKELCVWGDNGKPAKLNRIWPVFDSGGYGKTIMDILEVSRKKPVLVNALLFNIGSTVQNNFNKHVFNLKPLKEDWFAGLNTTWRQTQISTTIPNDDKTRRILTSVSKQIKIINLHMQQSMMRYKYPRVTRSNVLLENSNMGRPVMYQTKTLRAIRFQPTPNRDLPCYGNLELPFKIKQETPSHQIYSGVNRGVKVTDDDIQVTTNKVKVQVDTKVKVERSERDKDTEKEREKESR